MIAVGWFMPGEYFEVTAPRSKSNAGAAEYVGISTFHLANVFALREAGAPLPLPPSPALGARAEGLLSQQHDVISTVKA